MFFKRVAVRALVNYLLLQTRDNNKQLNEARLTSRLKSLYLEASVYSSIKHV